jgi:hypothetical protein
MFGMVQPARGLRFVLEPRHVLRGELGLDQVLADGLDRDEALDVRIEPLEDGAHRALAKGAPDLVLAEAFGLSHCAPASTFQHLHRLHEARLHPAHRLGQHADLSPCCGP